MPQKKRQRTGSSGPRQIDPLQAALDYGIDVSMLIDNLRRTPAERIKRHQAALNTTVALRRAKGI